MLQIDDANRVRTLTLNRPEALNAFNEALYDAVTDTLLGSAEDPGVAVVLLTGTGRAFCAGTDLLEMAARTSDPDFKEGVHGFTGLIDALIAFPKYVSRVGASPGTPESTLDELLAWRASERPGTSPWRHAWRYALRLTVASK